MNKLNWLDWTSLTLVVIGGINWGLVGFFNFDLVTAIFGAGTLSSVIFAVVGLAALYTIYTMTKLGTMSAARGERGEQRVRRAA